MTGVCYDRNGKFGPMKGSDFGKHDFEYLKDAFGVRVAERMPKFDKLLVKPFVLGDSPFYVDFLLYEYLDQFLRFLPNAFEGCDNVLAYLKRVESLPNLREWFVSDDYKNDRAFKVNAPMAVWTGE